jgi:hypothetical protein
MRFKFDERRAAISLTGDRHHWRRLVLAGRRANRTHALRGSAQNIAECEGSVVLSESLLNVADAMERSALFTAPNRC